MSQDGITVTVTEASATHPVLSKRICSEKSRRHSSPRCTSVPPWGSGEECPPMGLLLWNCSRINHSGKLPPSHTKIRRLHWPRTETLAGFRKRSVLEWIGLSWSTETHASRQWKQLQIGDVFKGILATSPKGKGEPMSKSTRTRQEPPPNSEW